MQASLDDVAAEVAQMEADGLLASPKAVEDAPDAAEIEGVEGREGIEARRRSRTVEGAKRGRAQRLRRGR